MRQSVSTGSVKTGNAARKKFSIAFIRKPRLIKMQEIVGMTVFLSILLLGYLASSTVNLETLKRSNNSLMRLASTLSTLQLETVVSIHLVHQHMTHVNMISFSDIWPE